MKVVVMDQNIFEGEYVPYLNALAPLTAMGVEFKAYPGAPAPSDEEKYERIKDADIVLFAIYDIPTSVLKRLGKLRAVVFMGVGYKSCIDEKYCNENGIDIYFTPGYGCNTVAEYTIALAFALCRRICAADRRFREHDWRQDGLEGCEISGKTFGVAGTGAIGSLVAQKASLLGARVLAYSRSVRRELTDTYNVEYVDLEALFRRSDIVSLHLSIGVGTDGIVTKKLIESMKNGAFFINTARASVMEDGYDAVLRRVREGTLAGAAIDVFSAEPVGNYGDYAPENVIATPHMAFLTGNAMGNMLLIACEKIMEFIKKNA